jgi:hypothetical protein
LQLSLLSLTHRPKQSIIKHLLMASTYLQKFPVPEQFPEILHDLLREILREQPEDIIAFSYRYFKDKNEGVGDTRAENKNYYGKQIDKQKTDGKSEVIPPPKYKGFKADPYKVDRTETDQTPVQTQAHTQTPAHGQAHTQATTHTQTQTQPAQQQQPNRRGSTPKNETREVRETRDHQIPTPNDRPDQTQYPQRNAPASRGRPDSRDRRKESDDAGPERSVGQRGDDARSEYSNKTNKALVNDYYNDLTEKAMNMYDDDASRSRPATSGDRRSHPPSAGAVDL